MTDANWHRSFNLSSLLGQVKLEKFLEKHRVERENIRSHITPCVLCRSTAAPGLLLNNGSYLCASCFDELSRLSYPEKYERLWRDYLATHEAWRLVRAAYIQTSNARTEQRGTAWANARQSFNSQSPYSGMASFFGVAAVICFFVIFAFPPVAIIGVIIAGFLAASCNSADTNRMRNWEKENPRPDSTKLESSRPIPGWDTQNPEPRCPVLRHFHDPQAKLTQRDHAILNVFNHWPGYPPFWDYLKEVVQRRDANRCQVTGCPSRVAIHVYHMQPTHQGGKHTPDNLVCLCAFHHGLEPEVGYERVWDDIKNQYFTLTRALKRKNPSGHGEHFVCAHVRRLELVTAHELEAIAKFHGFACSTCGNSRLLFAVDEDGREVDVSCAKCGDSWTAKRALTEETGPRLAEILTVSRNAGRWQANWKMFADRNHAVFKTQQLRRHRQGTIRATKPLSTRKRVLRATTKRPPDLVMQAVRRVGNSDSTRNLPFKVIKLEQGTQEWLNWRHSRIGASDASTIMGENRFKSPSELLHEKKNRIDTKPNSKMRRGTALEPKARSLYQKNTKTSIQPICIQSNSYSWLIASLDGLSSDYKNLVEIKCGESAYRQASKGIIPTYYYGQLQHQLMITGLISLDYWCYWPRKKGILMRVKRDNSYIKKLFKQEKKFYQSMRKT